MTTYDTLLVLARLILPPDLLECFDIIKIESDADMLTIYLDEQNIPSSSSSRRTL